MITIYSLQKILTTQGLFLINFSHFPILQKICVAFRTDAIFGVARWIEKSCNDTNGYICHQNISKFCFPFSFPFQCFIFCSAATATLLLFMYTGGLQRNLLCDLILICDDEKIHPSVFGHCCSFVMGSQSLSKEAGIFHVQVTSSSEGKHTNVHVFFWPE